MKIHSKYLILVIAILSLGIMAATPEPGDGIPIPTLAISPEPGNTPTAGTPEPGDGIHPTPTVTRTVEPGDGVQPTPSVHYGPTDIRIIRFTAVPDRNSLPIVVIFAMAVYMAVRWRKIHL